MTLKEVKAEIIRLEQLKAKLEMEEIDVHKEQARKFVGLCYKTPNDEILKIIGIPRTISTMTRNIYDKYQFPAVFLRYPELPREVSVHSVSWEDFSPCYFDTVYLDVAKGKPGTALFFEQYEEITPEEFYAEFDKCMEHFKELIDMRKPEPLSEEEFIAKYCRWCGTQRCIGPSDELALKGCEHYQKHFGGNAK
jgi:hypothetical protein